LAAKVSKEEINITSGASVQNYLLFYGVGASEDEGQ